MFMTIVEDILDSGQLTCDIPGTIQDHAARALRKKQGSAVEATDTAIATATTSTTDTTAMKGSPPRALDMRLRARQLLRFMSRSPPLGRDMDHDVGLRAKIGAVRSAIEEIPEGHERLAELASMYKSNSTASDSADENDAENEPFFDRMTPGQLVAYIKRNLVRWLDALVPLSEVNMSQEREEGPVRTSSPSPPPLRTNAAAAAVHEELGSVVLAGGSDIASSTLDCPTLAASSPSGAAAPDPSLPTSAAAAAATAGGSYGHDKTQEEPGGGEEMYDFSSLDDGSEAFRFCLIEWNWARRYRVLSYTDFQSTPGDDGNGPASRYARWIRTERPAEDFNPVPQWVRDEEHERARRLGLPETEYRTKRFDNGVKGLPGGGYGAWRKDSRGRWVRILAGGKCVAPKSGVFGLTGDWSSDRDDKEA